MLYETEGRQWGTVPRGVEVEYTSPKFAKAGNFSKYFLSRKGQSKSTLDTSIVSLMETFLVESFFASYRLSGSLSQH